jgi:DNA-binding transcriptional MerR regulator
MESYSRASKTRKKRAAMKTGEAAKILGVDVATIRRWIERDEIAQFFSDSARSERGSTQRILTEADVLVLNTVLTLRTREKENDWEAIAAYLDSGRREQSFPQNAISADPRTIPLPQAEQSARAMATMAERDAALARVDELAAEIEKMQREHKAETEALRRDHKAQSESLLREIAELSRQIGKLEGLLEALRGKGE